MFGSSGSSFRIVLTDEEDAVTNQIINGKKARDEYKGIHISYYLGN